MLIEIGNRLVVLMHTRRGHKGPQNLKDSRPGGFPYLRHLGMPPALLFQTSSLTKGILLAVSVDFNLGKGMLLANFGQRTVKFQ